MKFSEMNYERPVFDQEFDRMKGLLGKMENAQTEEEFFKTYDELEEASVHLETMGTLAYIRHTINTQDEFYQKEQDIFDEESPRFQEIATESARISLNSKFRSALEAKYGSHLLEKFEVQLKTFSPEIVPDLVEENKLSSEYQKLTASANILFEGEVRNLSRRLSCAHFSGN